MTWRRTSWRSSNSTAAAASSTPPTALLATWTPRPQRNSRRWPIVRSDDPCDGPVSAARSLRKSLRDDRDPPDDLSGDATRALIAAHLSGMHEASPPESVFALDVAR